jgi:NADPH-dependent 2,4-dienoyl-CoA reductase/sulfur reductase-like enzyme
MSLSLTTPRLVIGNGGAAASAVMAMRQAGYQGGIGLVADDAVPPFNPMLLPYWLKGMISSRACHPFGQDFYQDYGVDARLGLRVTKLDAKAKTAALSDGSQLTYEQCLIATGAGCAIPNLPGLREAERALPFRTRLCGERMLAMAKPNKTAVVLGASLVGAKLAEVLAGLGLKVILVDIADRLIPGAAHMEASLLLQTLLQQEGVEILLNHRLERVTETGNKIRLHFTEAGEIAADFACVCTGVRPCLEFLDSSQVSIRTGVLVDGRSRCDAEGLFAAGDAAEGRNLLSGRYEWFGLWGKARSQGQVAGSNMAGVKASYAGTLPEYITPLGGRVFAGLGNVNGHGQGSRTFIYKDAGDAELAVLSFEHNRLNGFNLIGGLGMLDLLKTALVKRLDLSQALSGGAPPSLAGLLEKIAHRVRLDLRTALQPGEAHC